MIPSEKRTLAVLRYHRVMIDNGFVAMETREPAIARYSCEDSITLDLPRGTRVQDRAELFRLIFEHGIKRGVSIGRQDGITKITESLRKLIQPD